MEIREFHKKQRKTLPADKRDELLKKMRKDHEKMVSGMFEFTDAQGGWFEFVTRFFPGEPLVYYKIIHGETCDLPMGVVKHLNNTVRKIRTFGAELTERGLTSSFVRQSRVRFTPVDVI